MTTSRPDPIAAASWSAIKGSSIVHNTPAPNPLAVGMARLTSTLPPDALMRLLTPEGQQSLIVASLAAVYQKNTTLEEHMASTDEQIAAITSNLDNVRGDVSRLTAEIERVQGELEDVDPALAAKLQPLVEQSKAIADATPEPAAPPVDGGDEPAPVEDGGTDVVNPTVDENGDPVT